LCDDANENLVSSEMLQFWKYTNADGRHFVRGVNRATIFW